MCCIFLALMGGGWSEGGFEVLGGGLLYPDKGSVDPGFVSGGVFNMDPIVLDFEDFHGKKFIYRCPAHFGKFGAGSFSEIGFIIFDDGAFEFLGGEGSVDPIRVSIQILHLFPVISGF